MIPTYTSFMVPGLLISFNPISLPPEIGRRVAKSGEGEGSVGRKGSVGRARHFKFVFKNCKDRPSPRHGYNRENVCGDTNAKDSEPELLGNCTGGATRKGRTRSI